MVREATFVLAVDPGDAHVGLAGWRKSGVAEGAGNVACMEIDAPEAPEEVRDILVVALRTGERCVLVVEEYVLYGGARGAAQTWQPMLTSEMIGALKFIAKELGVAVVEQGAGIKKPTRAQLEPRGIDQIGSGTHERDAELHLLHYLLKEGLWHQDA